jgi:hypothetical protein
MKPSYFENLLICLRESWLVLLSAVQGHDYIRDVSLGVAYKFGQKFLATPDDKLREVIEDNMVSCVNLSRVARQYRNQALR